MSQVIQLAPPSTSAAGPINRGPIEHDVPAIRTDGVYVVFTAIDETFAAVRIADRLRRTMGVPLTLIHFRVVSYPLSVGEAPGMSPTETAAFVEHLRAEGIDARVRVFLCRNERRAIPLALKQRSLVVVAGRPSWWPTRSERWRRRLEAAGHFVVFVDMGENRERFDA
jgi:hypothetical protein